MKSFFRTVKLLAPNKKECLFLLFLGIIDSGSQIILPLCFAQITTNAVVQNNNLARLWLSINFLITILSLTIKQISIHKINKLNSINFVQFTKKYNKSVAQSLISLTEPIYLNVCYYLKLFILIFISFFISINLFIFLTISVILCLFIGFVLKRFKRVSVYTHNIIEYVWLSITTILILILLHDLNKQQISLTSFLVVITFISNHLLKPNKKTDIKLKVEEALQNVENIKQKNRV